MSADKTTPKVGSVLEGNEKRDAIHIAVAASARSFRVQVLVFFPNTGDLVGQLLEATLVESGAWGAGPRVVGQGHSGQGRSRRHESPRTGQHPGEQDLVGPGL